MFWGSDVTIMQHRREAAEGALKFYTDVVDVRSPNIPNTPTYTTANIVKLQACRDINEQTVLRLYANAAKTGLGNCM